MKNQDVYNIAVIFRKAIFEAKVNREFSIQDRMSKFPNGCCDDSCDLLAYYLYETYYIHTKQGNGVYRDNNPNNTTNHAWLVMNGQIIIDITADQFKFFSKCDGRAILCEEIEFKDFQSFLYYDFFYAIKRNFIVNKCKNCGEFFLIRSGKYMSYCDKPLVNDKDKTCRDVGAKRKYDDKCKNDPIWQTYSRAYKAHYARYMKKKMTISEFEKWSRYASDLRDTAIAGKIDFEQYYTDIRK